MRIPPGKVWVISKETEGQGWTETQQWNVRLFSESGVGVGRMRVSGKDEELIRARVPSDKMGWRGEMKGAMQAGH